MNYLFNNLLPRRPGVPIVVFWLWLAVAPAVLPGQVVSGRVTDLETGDALIGVTVKEENTGNGTVTDANGSYTLKLTKAESAIVVTYTGYASQRIATNGGQLDVELAIGSELDEVVVTALGIAREKKSLTYAAQELSSSDVNRVKDANVINSLSGRTAGVQINRSGSGVGGSTRVVMRGNKSTRDNNVLYVIDGIPMFNYSSAQPTDVWGQATGSGQLGRDAGDAISNLNPEDIESLSVLHGASAAALYGSQAANGVILVTTKKGKAGQTRVDVSSNTTFENPTLLPELQYRYGQTAAGSEFSWGNSVSAADHVSDFYRTGTTYINSIGLTGGNEMAQTYFSYANTHSDGILPTSQFNRHNVTLRETASFWKNRLNLGATVNYVNARAENRAAAGGLYFNPLTGLYLFPRGLDFNDYGENGFEKFDETRRLNLQNWIVDRDDWQNPYWVLHRNPYFDVRDRILGTATIGLKLADWATLQFRGNLDKTYDRFEQHAYAGTASTLADANGRLVMMRAEGTQRYGDVLLNLNRTFDRFSFAATLGSSITDVKLRTQTFDSKGASLDGQPLGLRYANIFTIQNTLPGTAFGEQQPNRSQLQSVFASVNLGFRNMFYVDVTGRNDWSSTLAFTDNLSYFYPSVGATAILSEMFDMGGLDFAKIRASYAEVGNGVSPYDTYLLYAVSSNGATPPTTGPLPGKEFQPERSKSFEVGADLRFWQNRAGLDLTWYRTNTINQRIVVSAPRGSGQQSFTVNAGDIQNSGIEAMLSLVPVRVSGFEWSTNITYTRNVNEVIELTPLLSDGTFTLTDGGVNNYDMVIREGYAFGEIRGRGFARAPNGAIYVTDEGVPIAGADTVLGNSNPDFLLGWNNTLSLGNFSLGFLIDGRFGGEVMSITQAVADRFGVSEETAAARDAGGVNVQAVRQSDGQAWSGPLDPAKYYTAVGGRDGITEAYVYDGTSVRLRELSIGYTLPRSLLENIGRGVGARIALVGRNLIYFRNDAPFDPDVSMSTGTGLQGIDVFGLPAVRSYGLNLSLTF
jgi:TonB-linked SusC/RagA family outer membrane protein